MYQTINYNDFRDAFRRMDRADQFSKAGLYGLFQHLEELEESTGETIELDVIALCCEYQEDTYADVAANYNVQMDDGDDESDVRQAVIEYLEDHTQIAWRDDDTVLYACF